MNKSELLEKASDILACRPEKMECKEVLEGNAFYFRNIDRGGAAVIISIDGEMLYGDPFFMGFDEHLKKFKEGKRTEIS